MSNPDSLKNQQQVIKDKVDNVQNPAGTEKDDKRRFVHEETFIQIEDDQQQDHTQPKKK